VTGDTDKPAAVPVEGKHEFQEKRVDAGVDDGHIEHQTLPTAEAQELEERKAKLAAEAFLKAKRESSPAATRRDPKRNQGSVIAVVAVVAVLVVIILGFAILMWRLHKSENATKEYLLAFLDR
jgi:uncharacterized protein HemX